MLAQKIQPCKKAVNLYFSNSSDEKKHETHNLVTKQQHNKEKNYFESLRYKYAEVQHCHKRGNVLTLKAKSTFYNSYANIDRYEFAHLD